MQDEAGAAFIPLETNWRSAPELLDALNCLFGDGAWFAHDKGIPYREVHPPNEAERQVRIVTDLTNRPALTIVDVRPWERLKEAAKQHAQFIAYEVHRLLRQDGPPPLVIAKRNGDPRPLEPADICILVFRRSEAVPLTEALELLGIPYSLHRPTGFWQSDEVQQIEMLLGCLARPEERASLRKAFLTCFFRIPPARLALPGFAAQPSGTAAVSALAGVCRGAALVRPVSVDAGGDRPVAASATTMRRPSGWPSCAR